MCAAIVILSLMCIRYLIGCDNLLAKIHTRNPSACDKVGGVIIMHIDDLRRFALLWLHKSVEVHADKAHYATNITGDIYGSGWISEMYGYSFAAAEVCVIVIFSSFFARTTSFIS
jgi:peptidyl serine alpha-galactosyltransferase